MAGLVVMLLGGPISWKAYRLESTPLSSCEGEYSAATRAAIEAKADVSGIQFMTFQDKMVPSPIFCDNRSAVMLSESATSSKRLKHVATRLAFLKELVSAGEILLFWVPSGDQIADIFTKPLIADKFHPLRVFLIS